MALRIVLNAGPRDREAYPPLLRPALAGAGLDAALEVATGPGLEDPGSVDFLVATPIGPVQDYAPFTGLRAVLSLWAGVERFLSNDSLRGPLVRMIDPGLTAGMVEWVAGHVLRHHLGIDRHLAGQDGVWRPEIPPLAADRIVAVLGLGALGMASAEALAGLGFTVRGWARTPRSRPGFACHAGPAGLRAALDGADMVVALLPETPATTGLLDAETLGWLAPGAVVLNPGRGPLIDDAALLDALDRGHLGHATLDVFRTEPLPPSHRFWSHPQVTVTPHVASATRPRSAVHRLAEAIAALQAGISPPGLVDPVAGY